MNTNFTFAYAMGLKRNLGNTEKKSRREGKKVASPRLRFI